MFGRRRQGTVIAEGLKISGSVSAEGFVELHGEIEGELRCTSLSISKKGRIDGKIFADDVVVNGTVDGPINAGHVNLLSRAHVTGNIHHKSFAIEKGAYFAGQSIQKDDPEKEKPVRQLPAKDDAAKNRKAPGPKVAKETKAVQSGAAPLA